MILTNMLDPFGNPMTMEELKTYPKISYSEMTTLQRCKRQWYYQYMQGLKPATTASYFSKGKYLHGVAAELLRGRTDLDSIYSDVVQSILDEGDNLDSIPAEEITRLNEQAQETTSEILSTSKDVPYVEVEFYADLGVSTKEGTPVLLHGFVDAVTVTSEGKLWLVEHKTASRAWSADQFNFSFQDTLYAAAMEAILRESVQGSTFVFYLSRQNNPVEYRNKFITHEMKAVAVGLMEDVVAMRESLRSYPMEPLFGCGGCPFQAVCRANLAGTDVQYMLDTQFVVDEERKARFTNAD